METVTTEPTVSVVFNCSPRAVELIKRVFSLAAHALHGKISEEDFWQYVYSVCQSHKGDNVIYFPELARAALTFEAANPTVELSDLVSPRPAKPIQKPAVKQPEQPRPKQPNASTVSIPRAVDVVHKYFVDNASGKHEDVVTFVEAAFNKIGAQPPTKGYVQVCISTLFRAGALHRIERGLYELQEKFAERQRAAAIAAAAEKSKREKIDEKIKASRRTVICEPGQLATTCPECGNKTAYRGIKKDGAKEVEVLRCTHCHKTIGI